jgi:hypothetical protein
MWKSYEPRNYKTHNLLILKLPFKSSGPFNHINTMKFRVYYREENGDIFSNLDFVSDELKISSMWSKVDLIFINHLHYLACLNDLFMRCSWTCHFILVLNFKLSCIPIFLMHKVSECAPKFSFLLPIFVITIQGSCPKHWEEFRGCINESRFSNYETLHVLSIF